jgi:hypothetical protein
MTVGNKTRTDVTTRIRRILKRTHQLVFMKKLHFLRQQKTILFRIVSKKYSLYIHEIARKDLEVSNNGNLMSA